MSTSFVRKLRQILCCEPRDVDHNEGPPPSPFTIAPQAATATAATDQPQQQITQQPTQHAAEASVAFTGEEQPEPIEEDWSDEESEPSHYKPEDFVVEEGEYYKYNYDPSPFERFDDVQKAFEEESQIYGKSDVGDDANTIWGNRKYERSIRNWNSDQGFNPTPAGVQAAAR